MLDIFASLDRIERKTEGITAALDVAVMALVTISKNDCRTPQATARGAIEQIRSVLEATRNA